MAEDKKNKTQLSPQFSNLVLSIASTALIKMGLDSHSKEEKNLELARYNYEVIYGRR